MMNTFGCSAIKFEKYSSKDPLINISMDYIAGWRYSETRGADTSYAQVLFFPFEEGKKSPRVLIDLTVKDISKIKLEAPTLKAAEDGLLAKRMKLKDAKILSISKNKVLDAEATVIELSYLMLENTLDVKSKLIPVKEKIIISKKNNNFYFLRYESPAQEFSKYDSAFMRIARSMKIK